MSDQDSRLREICLDPGKFFEDEPTTLYEDVLNSLCEQTDADYLDPYTVKQNQAWNFLANKVVGSELSGT